MSRSDINNKLKICNVLTGTRLDTRSPTWELNMVAPKGVFILNQIKNGYNNYNPYAFNFTWFTNRCLRCKEWIDRLREIVVDLNMNMIHVVRINICIHDGLAFAG